MVAFRNIAVALNEFLLRVRGALRGVVDVRDSDIVEVIDPRWDAWLDMRASGEDLYELEDATDIWCGETARPGGRLALVW